MLVIKSEVDVTEHFFRIKKYVIPIQNVVVRKHFTEKTGNNRKVYKKCVRPTVLH